MKQFFSELRRRHVFKVAAAYGVVGWLVVQAAAIVFPTFGAPAWVLQVSIAMVLLGFPVAVVLAWAFELTPEGVRRAGSGATGASRAGVAALPRPRARRAIVAVGLLVAGVGVLAVVGGKRSRAAGLDPNTLAVLPFRVSGSDPSHGYLREGMVDLLSSKLVSEGGPTVLDPRTVLAAWQRGIGSVEANPTAEEIEAIAREIGSGLVLRGEVVGQPAHLSVTARLEDVVSRRVRAQAMVEGPADSLPALVDRMAAELLLVQAGEGARRVEEEMTRSLPALRLYLEGQSAYRRGRYRDAMERFGDAVRLDSTFSLAALGLWMAASWTHDAPAEVLQPGLAVAWAGRDRLNPRDSLLLVAIAGPRYPEQSPAADVLAVRERAAEVLSDRPEAWFHLGDQYFHDGSWMGVPDWRERARRAFSRAAALDSTYAAPLQHLVDLAAWEGDVEAARAAGRAYLAVSDSGDWREYVRWVQAQVTVDSAAADSVRARFETMPLGTLGFIARSGQIAGLGIEDTRRAAAALARRASTRAEMRRARLLQVELAFNTGRPQEALDHLNRTPPEDSVERLWPILQHAMYGDLPRELGAAAAESLGRMLPSWGRPILRPSVVASTIGVWEAEHGSVEAARARLGGANEDAVLWQAALAAAIAVRTGEPAAPVLLARLDSVVKAGRGGNESGLYAAWVAARAAERAGDRAGALAAIRARPVTSTHLATFLREEGRLAAAAGDREGAIRAYRKYLALRADPEPALRAEVERIRRELARLEGQRSAS